MADDIVLEPEVLESLISTISGETQLLTIPSRVYSYDVQTLPSAVRFIDQHDSIYSVVSLLKDLVAKDMSDIAMAEDLLIQSETTLANDYDYTAGDF